MKRGSRFSIVDAHTLRTNPEPRYLFAQIKTIISKADSEHRLLSEFESLLTDTLLSEYHNILHRGRMRKCKWCDREMLGYNYKACCSGRCKLAFKRSLNTEVHCIYCKHVKWITKNRASSYPGWCSQICWLKSKEMCKRESTGPRKYDYQDNFKSLIAEGAKKYKAFKYNIKDIQSWVDTTMDEFLVRLQQATEG